MKGLTVTGSALHKLQSSSYFQVTKFPLSIPCGTIDNKSDVKDVNIYIDEFGKRFELLNCHNCTLIVSHELISDKLAKSKVRMIRKHPVLICKEDCVMAQAYCQTFLKDWK